MMNEKSVLEKLSTGFIKKGWATQKEFSEWVNAAHREHKSLVDWLYQSNRVPNDELAYLLSQIFGYPSVNLDTFAFDEKVLKLLPESLVRKYKALPITAHERTLTLVISDPTDLGALDDISALVGMRVRPAVAAPDQINKAIQKYYTAQEAGSEEEGESFENILEAVRTQVLERPFLKDAGDLSDLLELANATPVIKLVNHLLIEAIRRRASDVFVEPLEKTMRVRYRVDGLLEQIVTSPKDMAEPVISRIKVMSRLNIAEHRIPQDGRFKVRISGPEVDLRISILPTCYGEKACIRILDTRAETQNLDVLGFSPSELEIMRRAAEKPHGMILVTGPTGSGKTTTLYAVLQYLNSPDKNITTVEEPVEYQLEGINQVNVREQVGLTFPAALRSILRQDPDIILVGEIRDQVTMDIAIKAALTGHLVLSTLHTNDSTSAIVRMINMGIEPFLIASSVLMISAQRLLRRLCPVCRVAYTPDPKILGSLELPPGKKYQFFKPKGCDRCRSSGYKGRTVITELFEMKPEILDLIVSGGSNDELRILTKKLGMRTLRECAVAKAMEGVTSIEEVFRVTSHEKKAEPQEV